MKSLLKYFIVMNFLIVINSCNKYRFVVKKHNEFVINLKSEGKEIYGGELLIYKKWKNDFIINKEMKKLNKLNSLIPNQDYSSSYRLFLVTYNYLKLMKNYVSKSKEKDKLVTLTKSEFDFYKAHFDSIQQANPVYPIQKND